VKHLVLAAFVLVLPTGCREEKPAAFAETSPGGIAYTFLRIPDAKDVAIQIAWPSDWALREGVNQAVPYIGADLILSGGAEGYPAGEVGETLADLEVEAYLSVSTEYVLGELIAPKEHLAEAVKIANAHLRAPALDQGWFNRIQQGFAAKMAEVAALPATRGFAAIRWAVLGDAPLRRALSVDPPEQITAATRDEVAQWHRQTLVRNGAKIVIAGALDADAAGTALDALLAGLPEGSGPTATAPKADFRPRRILLHVADAPTSLLAFIAPLPPTRDGRESDDIVLVSALGGDDQSVLFDAVRTKLRASYGFEASIDGFTRDLRFLAFVGEVETAKIAEAETVVRTAYADFRKTGPTGDLAERLSPLFANAERMSKLPGAASVTALMALLDGQDPGLALDLKSVLTKVDAATLQSRLTTAFPAPDAFIVLAVSSDVNALPGACVIDTPADAARCP
jgi:predicted Zn-dependent peptidase